MISVRTLTRTLKPALLICDCCQRKVDYVRGSMWHGTSRICRLCFFQWYDPDGGVDQTDPISIGNHVRAKHDLPPLPLAALRER